MKVFQLRRFCLLPVVLIFLAISSGCTDEFYLSEREVAAYTSVVETESRANLNFDNLQGRTVNLLFDNSSGTPRLRSTNLLLEMRRTEMAQLESGPAAVSLDHLNAELEKQIGNWIEGRLELYSTGDDRARLTALDYVGVHFLNNPTFIYHAERQSIEFDVRLEITINCTIEVNAVNWLINVFANINGTYPIVMRISDLRLHGEASLLSSFANAACIRFQLTPQNLGTIGATAGTNVTVPSEVLQGVGQVLTINLSSSVDQLFCQNYAYFSLPYLSLSANGMKVIYRSKAEPQGPAESTDPTLHLVARATDGKLYHARRGVAGWTDYINIAWPSPSPTPYPRIDNDPTLVHSGNGQLELTATDVAGNLVYAHWRDEAWGNWKILPPNTATNPPIYYRGKPALVASAPGQAEIISTTSYGSLWHTRRINGIWQQPVTLPQLTAANMSIPLRDPVAVVVGSAIAVIYVDNQNRLFGQVFDMDTSVWGFPIRITTQESVRYGPAAATWSAQATDQVAIAYVGQSGATYFRVLDINIPNPSVTPGSEVALGNFLNASPILVASAHRQLELFGRGADNRLKHNHFVNALGPFVIDGRTVNPGWQGWAPMAENLFGTAITTDGRMSDFSAVATPTGRVELAARGYSNVGQVTQNVFHNSYESTRYAFAPWKTVQWRGYDVAGSQLVVGRPTLAAIDQNFQVGFEGNFSGGVSLYYGRLSASNLTDFTSGSNARTGTDPVVLSSGIGITDYLYIGTDFRLHHDRWFGHGGGYLYTLTVPTGVRLIGKLAAASYGNGSVDLVSLGNDGRIYHWRFRDSNWSPPVAVANQMASSPALVHTGAGQLELLAVDIDHRLFRWRFSGGSWGSRLSVPSTFRINEALFKPMSASSFGDGAVDVAVVNLDTRELYHRRIGPEDEICTLPIGCPAPRVFNNLGGSVIDAPVITAFSPTRINILTMQAGLAWFSTWSDAAPFQPVTVPPLRDPVLRWSGFEDTGGREMVVGAAANAGPRNYAAVAINFDGRILINRNTEGRWTGFQPLIGQSPEMILHSPIVLPTLAAHGN